MDLALVFPPAWPSFSPYPSLPALAGALRPMGLEVHQYDLNCECFDDLLSAPQITRCIHELEQRISSRRISTKAEAKQNQYYLFQARGLLRFIEGSKADIRNPDAFYDDSRLQRAFNTIDNAFALYDYLQMPKTVSVLPFQLAFGSVKDVQQLLTTSTPLNDFFLRRIDEIIRLRPLVVGFSVHCFSQLYFALLAAQHIKERQPDVFTTIGGTYLLRHRRWLQRFGAILKGFDTAVVYDGVTALLHICGYVAGERREIQHPNILKIQRGQIQPTSTQPYLRISSFVVPDMDGLPIGKYFSPHLIVSLPISSGCHWRRCTFCSYNLHPYAFADSEEVVEAISVLSTKYNTRWFYFSVSELAVDHIETLCEAIKRRNITIYWTSLTRPTIGLGPTLCKSMFESGCRLMALGVESASPAVLAAMKKGITPTEAADALRNLSDAGIAVIAYFMHDFPHEGLADLRMTLQFIDTNRRYLFGYVLAPFVMTGLEPVGLKARPADKDHHDVGGEGNLLEVLLHFGVPSPSIDRTDTDGLARRKQHLVRQFKLRSRNFYLDSEQSLPMRSPADVLLDFLYICSEKIEHGPGRFDDREAFLSATVSLDRPLLHTVRITENYAEERSFESCFGEDSLNGLLLYNPVTQKSIPLTKTTMTILFSIQRNSSVRELIDTVRCQIRNSNCSDNELLWRIGALYRDHFIQLQ